MHDLAIRTIDAWTALDSRGEPTVACRVTLGAGASGTAMAPSGASTGSHEAKELRDLSGAWTSRGVSRAVSHVTGPLAAALAGVDAAAQQTVDDVLREVDGTDDLSRMGANAVLAVSVAVARAAAAAQGLPLWRLWTDQPLLPMPMVNVFSGGAHAAGMVDIQDVLVIPIGAETFSEALQWCWLVRRQAAKDLEGCGFSASLVADEGGLSAPLPTNRAALELVAGAVQHSGLAMGRQVALAVDVAATELQAEDGRYRFACENRDMTGAELIAEIAGWCEEFGLVSVEDPLGEDDWSAWTAATAALNGVQVIGDDLFVTDVARVAKGVSGNAATSVLIKVNQIGTLTAALDALQYAQDRGLATVLSARSGDTEDSWLADLAVGWRAGQIKVGSTHRSERLAKWNRLLEIEHEESGAAFATWRPVSSVWRWST